MEYVDWVRYKETVEKRLADLRGKVLEAEVDGNSKRLEQLKNLIKSNKKMQIYLDFVGQYWLNQ